MRLAEALIRRRDLAEYVDQMKGRLSHNAMVPEGEEPDEDIAELREALDQKLRELGDLIYNINRTNMETDLGNGETLQQAIIRRDMVERKHKTLSDLSVSGRRMYRYSREEVKYVSVVDKKEIRSTLDTLAKERREVDVLIQATNWATDLLE